MSNLHKLTIITGLCVLIFWGVTTIIKPISIAGDSMYPEYPDGSFHILYKLQYKFTTPKTGDVVLYNFTTETNTYEFIGRIAATPNQDIRIENGTAENQVSYTLIDTKGNRRKTEFQLRYEEQQTINLKSDQYFLLGDSRDNSIDSRYFGQVSADKIVGKIIWRYK
ncbi:MAG: signal peptidase I [bacterium]|nr:signal peptidase I [bacterium]